MEDAPVTLPAYPSFSLSTEASPESCCTFCTHQRRKQWKQIFRNGTPNFPSTAHESKAAEQPLTIYFASYKELAQPASNVVKAIVDQEFSAGEPATIVIWRNDVREVIQALKTLSDARAAAMRTAAWVADQREIYYAARPVRRRHSSLP